MMKKRVEEIDILKALGIILMVAGHAGFPYLKFVSLFHMAIFFIASGFLYNESDSDSIATVFNSIKRKVKHIWWPFFVWNLIYILLRDVFIRINVYANDPNTDKYLAVGSVMVKEPYSFHEKIIKIARGVMMYSDQPMFGASWFLKALFMLSITFVIADFVIKKISERFRLILQIIVSVLMMIGGYWCHLTNRYAQGFNLVGTCYFLYFVGHYIAKNRRLFVWNNGVVMIISSISFAILFIMNPLGVISLGNNDYPNPLFFLVASISGWFFLYGISCLLKQFRPLRYVLKLIGQNTLPIVILHFLAFKLVALIVAKYYNLPQKCIAAFPNLYGEIGGWWIVYTLVGLVVPIALYDVYKIIKNVVSK